MSLRGANFVKNSAFFQVFLGLTAMAASLALANPRQYGNLMLLPSAKRVSIASNCNGIACRSTKRTRPPTDPPVDWTTHMFVRRDCPELPEGDAYIDDLVAHGSTLHMRGELSLGGDCGPAVDNGGNDQPNDLVIHGAHFI
jgi:hypothetical protein